MTDASYIDWPFFEPAHREHFHALHAWAKHQNFTHSDDVDADCKALVKALGVGGWLRACVPAAYGGLTAELDVRSIALSREILGFYSGLADFSLAMQGLGSGAISLFGSDAQRQAYLPDVAAGKKIAAFALSESEAGSDVAAMQTSASENGDTVILNGEKTWISNGGIADFYCVFARSGEAPGARGLSAYIVDADSPGFRIGERINTIAPHPLATLHFENCEIPASNRIGEGGRGFAIAMATLDVFRQGPKLEHKEVAFPPEILLGTLGGFTGEYLATWLGNQLAAWNIKPEAGQAAVWCTTDRGPGVQAGVRACPFLLHVSCFSHVL
ncbi:MAG: acyl-CoA dehydrogenase family protein, partial [Pseudomonadota bacterium]